MALPSSGPISLQMLQDEFGGSNPISLSEYYRNGGLVPGNNTNVPTSGAISLSNFYNAVNEIAATMSNSTNQSASSFFGSNWGSSVPKVLTIPAGITVGSSNGNAALDIPSGMGGTLRLVVDGSIQGTGGAAAGGTGGNAVTVNQGSGVTVNINSGGSIYGGGGGGGQGGAGGAGGGGVYQTSYTVELGYNFTCVDDMARYGYPVNCDGVCMVEITNAVNKANLFCLGGATPAGQHCELCDDDTGGRGWDCAVCRETRYTDNPTDGGNGGSGGTGGQGQGYGQSTTTGSGGTGGTNGGTNAGSGGTGGTGGTAAGRAAAAP